ncbi:hypothetical protein QI30_17065 [Kurthia sp. 3B1D]|uniref:Uncharacterized protein n=1 Tax=Candidatus Kurthia intestinigallinarum TaxID=1562256 RepID=A0A433RPZ7_9BACL|nr:hypothetical protein QI30_17065 [Kurthia sp. 3B1D]
MKIIGLILILFFLINIIFLINEYIKEAKTEGKGEMVKSLFRFLVGLLFDIPSLYVVFVLVSLVVGIWFTFY